MIAAHEFNGVVSVEAPAKINLSLHVTGRRADGYHLLDSLVVFAGVHDLVTVSTATEYSLSIGGPFGAGLSANDDNLVLRAAHVLNDAVEGDRAAAIRLVKNLPIASGIGGGSADAAATLIALNRLWGLDIPIERLADIGLQIGADVPVCLFGRPARMLGVGEIIDPIETPIVADMLLINPRVSVSTPDVFSGLNGKWRTDPSPALSDPVVGFDSLIKGLTLLNNDLSEPAERIAPEIVDVLSMLQEQPGCALARMSGSGATCFGLFENKDLMEAASERLSAVKDAWWVCPTFVRGDR